LSRDADHLGVLKVVESGLLCAIDTGLLAGIESREDIWSEKTDRFDVRSGLWRLQVENILIEELREGVVVALTEEICLAHGCVGQRRVESGQGLKEQKRGAGK
jgi:hypothetical protein